MAGRVYESKIMATQGFKKYRQSHYSIALGKIKILILCKLNWLKSLKNNEDIMIMKADKANCTVILGKSD